MKTIYLANAFGFSAVERQLVLPEFVKRLEAIGLEVWEPFERNNRIVGKSEQWGCFFDIENRSELAVRMRDRFKKESLRLQNERRVTGTAALDLLGGDPENLEITVSQSVSIQWATRHERL